MRGESSAESESPSEVDVVDIVGFAIEVLRLLCTRSNRDMLICNRAGRRVIDPLRFCRAWGGGTAAVSVEPVRDRSDAVGVSTAEDAVLRGVVGVPGFLSDERFGGGGSMLAEAEPRLRSPATASTGRGFTGDEEPCE